MTEEQLRIFLTERKYTPEQAEETLKGLRPKVYQELASQIGKPIPTDAQADLLAFVQRKLFAEEIEVSKKGGVTWNTVKGQL